MSKLNISKNEFIEMASKSKSVSELARRLKYPRYYSNSKISMAAYREIKRKCEEYGIDYPIQSKDKYDTQLPDIVKESKAVAEVIRRLGLNSNSGSLMSKIKWRIDFLGLDISHFTGSSWSKGKTRFDDDRLNKQAEKIATPWKQAFRKNSRINNVCLLKRLILSGKREYRCALCRLSSWQDKPLRLRLDHIDGDSTNNVETNLRLLCPNCDSQTDTFCRGLKKRNKKSEWWEKLSNSVTAVAQSVGGTRFKISTV